MAGSVRARGKGRWEIRAWFGVDPATGKRKQYSAIFEGSRRDAEREAARVVVGIERGEITWQGATPKHDKLRMRQLLELYYASNAHNTRRPASWSANHTRSMRNALDKHVLPAIGDIYVDQLKPSELQRFYNLLTGPVAQKARQMIAPTTRKAFKDEMVGRDVSTMVDLPSMSKPRTRDVTLEELEKLHPDVLHEQPSRANLDERVPAGHVRIQRQLV